MYQSEHDFWAIKRAIRTKIVTCGLAEETEKGGRRKSQNRNISPPRGGAISQPIFTKFGEFVVDLTDVITPAKFGYKIFIGFSRPRGGKSHFPYWKAYGLYNSAMHCRAGLWWLFNNNDDDCIYTAILKATFNRKPFILSADTTYTYNGTQIILSPSLVQTE